MENPEGFHLNLEEILVGDINRLRYITRFSTALVAHRENVAEHSFYVTLYSLLIGLDVISQGLVSISLETVMLKALVHDLEECRTGDLYRPFKVSNPNLKRLVHDLGEKAVTDLFQGLTVGDTAIPPILAEKWDRAKSITTPEGCIVAFADYLSVLSHMLQELRVANMTMKTHYESMLDYAEEFDGPEFYFIRPYVLQAQGMVRELLGVKVKELETEV